LLEEVRREGKYPIYDYEADKLNKMEAKTWRLQRRKEELELALAGRDREARQLKSSRSWRLL